MPPGWVKAYYQQHLFPDMGGGNELTDRTQAACIVGHFCEQYVQHVLGGGLHDAVAAGIEPDLVHWCVDMLGFDLVVEVKGCGRRYGTCVTHDQVRRYAELTVQNFPLTRPLIYYAFVVHGVVGMTKEYATEWDLACGLGANLLGVVLLPLPVVMHLLDVMPMRVNGGWRTPCGGDDWLTSISGVQLHKLVLGDLDIPQWVREKSGEVGWADADRWDAWRGRLPMVNVHGVVVNSVWGAGLLPKW